MQNIVTRWIEMPDGTEQFDLGYDSGPNEDGIYESEDDDYDEEQSEIEDDLYDDLW